MFFSCISSNKKIVTATYISPTSSGGVKREHHSGSGEIYEDSQDYQDNEEYETVKRTKYSHDNQLN